MRTLHSCSPYLTAEKDAVRYIPKCSESYLKQDLVEKFPAMASSKVLVFAAHPVFENNNHGSLLLL
jgi:hypothetical protein